MEEMDEERLKALSLDGSDIVRSRRKDRRVAFILNPVSGHGRAGREWKQSIEPTVREIFAENEWKLYTTHRKGHAIELACQALKFDGFTTVVSIGGDGTHGEVLNGYIQAGGAPKGYEMTVLPFGTGGDFQRTMQLSTLSTKKLIKMIKYNDSLVIDCGFCESTVYDDVLGDDKGRIYADGHTKKSKTFFLNISSCGISGAICHSVEKGTKRFGGFATFLFHTCKETLLWNNIPIRWRMDDETDWKIVNLYQLVIANGQYFGGGVFVSPASSLCSSSLQAIEYRDVGVADISMLWRSYTGSHIFMSKVKQTSFRNKLEAQPIKSAKDVILIEIDGEVSGALPATWRCVPRSVLLIAPHKYIRKICGRRSFSEDGDENMPLCSSVSSSSSSNSSPCSANENSVDHGLGTSFRPETLAGMPLAIEVKQEECESEENENFVDCVSRINSPADLGLSSNGEVIKQRLNTDSSDHVCNGSLQALSRESSSNIVSNGSMDQYEYFDTRNSFDSDPAIEKVKSSSSAPIEKIKSGGTEKEDSLSQSLDGACTKIDIQSN